MITITFTLFCSIIILFSLAFTASKRAAQRRADKANMVAGVSTTGTVLGMPCVNTSEVSGMMADARDMHAKCAELTNLMNPALNGFITADEIDGATIGGYTAWRKAATSAVDAWTL